MHFCLQLELNCFNSGETDVGLRVCEAGAFEVVDNSICRISNIVQDVPKKVSF